MNDSLWPLPAQSAQLSKSIRTMSMRKALGFIGASSLQCRHATRIRLTCSHRWSSTGPKSHGDGSVQALLDKFNNPSSPFYMAPGEKGPAWPEPGDDNPSAGAEAAPTHSSTSTPGWPHDMPDYAEARTMAQAYAREHGFDLDSVVEWPVAWGETDQFRHINNVAFSRYFEVRIRRPHPLFPAG